MNKAILICLLSISAFGAMTQNYWCECSAFTVQNDCNNVVDCTWSNSACVDKACSAVATNICETLMTCSLNSSSGACEATQACSTYKTDSQLDCMLKKGNCGGSATAGTDGKFTCATYTPATCSNLTVANCKNNYEKENTFCWPTSDNTACKAYTLDNCVGIPFEVCAQVGCTVSGTTCAAPQCSQITAKESCTVVYNGPFGSETLCAWDTTTSKCQDRTSVSDLTADNCSLNTDGGYYWSSSSCNQCVQPTTNHSALLAILAVLLVFIF